LKILRLESSNFLKLKVVEIMPTGAVVTLTGPNSAGKSSVLASIFAALGGKDATPEHPIRRGEKKAHITLDLGEIVVTRRFTEKETTVIVEAASGARFPSPQRMLDSLIGKLSFDPLAFCREAPRAQLERLRSLVTLDVDVDALRGQNQRDFEARTEVNRNAASYRTQADAIVLPPDCPTERRDIREIVDRLASAAQHNADIERRRENRVRAEQTISDHAADLEGMKVTGPAEIDAVRDRANSACAEIDEQIAVLQRRKITIMDAASDEINRMTREYGERAESLEGKIADLRAKLDAAPPLPEPIDVAAVRSELSSAEDTNALADRAKAKAILQSKTEQEAEKSKALTEAIAARDKQREEAMAKAKFPIEGLAFGDGEVMFNGLPLSQASSAEQIRISMAIAIALNPKLRVCCIREASFLDEDGLRQVADMAAEHDFQIWLEDNRSTDPMAIVLEDGLIAGAAPKPEPPAETKQPGQLI
jgi:hypothetical protein